jgi:hypothetical protein
MTRRFYSYIADLVNVEPVRDRDKVMMGILQTLGIEQGKSFRPDVRMTEILERAVVDARAYLEHYFETPGLGMTPYWPDRQWQYVALDAKHLAGFSYETDDALDCTARAGEAVIVIAGVGAMMRLPERLPTDFD